VYARIEGDKWVDLVASFRLYILHLERDFEKKIAGGCLRDVCDISPTTLDKNNRSDSLSDSLHARIEAEGGTAASQRCICCVS